MARAALTPRVGPNNHHRRSTIAVWVFSFLVVLGSGLIIVNPTRGLPEEEVFRSKDFRSFYAAGQIIREGRSSALYDLDLQYAVQSREARLEGREDLLEFFNPPFVALLFAPLAGLSISCAYALWLFINSAMAVLCGVLVANMVEEWRLPRRLAVVFLVLTCAPLLLALQQGQFSVLLLLAALLSWRALRNGREVESGLWLGLFLIKPQLLFAPVCLLVLQRRWTVLAGLSVFTGLALVVSLVVVGPAGAASYLSLATAVANKGEEFGLQPGYLVTLRGIWHLAIRTADAARVQPWWMLSVAIVLAVAAFFLGRPVQRSVNDQAAAFSVILLVALLITPHLFFYDLALVAVPAVLLLRYGRVSDAPQRRFYVISLVWVALGYVLAMAAFWMSLQAITVVMASYLLGFFALCVYWVSRPEGGRV